MFCIRGHHCCTMLLVYSNHRHLVKYNQNQMRNKKVMLEDNMRYPLWINGRLLRCQHQLNGAAAITNLCPFMSVHLSLYVHSKFKKNGSLCFSVTPTQTGPCDKCSSQNWTSLNESFGLERSKIYKFMELWQLVSDIHLLTLYRGQIYFSWFPCNKHLNYVLTRQFPPVSSWIQWMTHDNPSSVVL